MSRTIEIPIKSFPKGWFVTWSVTSQCGFTGSIEIKSGGEILDIYKKNTHSSDLNVLGFGSRNIPSENMTIVVTVNEGSGPIYEQHQANLVLNQKGETVGITTAICVEDSDDFDFNDYCISLAGWAKKG